jgi:acyl carrier protein
MTSTCPMSQVTDCNMGSGHIAPVPAKAFTPEDDARLCDALKRCSPSTREAAREFRKTGSPAFVPAIVNGLIEHYVEPDARAKLTRADDGLRLIEDLAIDSLTMLEIVFVAEDVLQISIDNDELRPFRTVGDIKAFLAAKLGRVYPPGLTLTSGSPG